MPRDPARIDRVLALLREAWLKSPDQRLGQLVYNVGRGADMRDDAASPPEVWRDLFYVEDDEWERLLAPPLWWDR